MLVLFFTFASPPSHCLPSFTSLHPEAETFFLPNLVPAVADTWERKCRLLLDTARLQREEDDTTNKKEKKTPKNQQL